jgi:sRNA-binding regulator protein Hfq
MTRIGWLIAVVFSAAVVFLFVSAREGRSATILLRHYNNPESPTMRLLNERQLDGIIDGIVSYNVLLQENKTNKLFCLPSDAVVTVQHAEAIINHVSKRLAKPDDVPISVLLIVGLQETFACS